MKLIHITDTYLGGPGLRLYGLDPRARLNAALHHPPYEVGVSMMDQITLAQPARFMEVVRPHRAPHPAFLFRPPASPGLGQLARDPVFDVARHPPPVRVVLISEDRVVIHTHDYLDVSVRVPFSRPDMDERADVLGPFPSQTRPPQALPS